VDMAAAWKQDYPNLRDYYIFQIWPGLSPLLEVQRNLPRLYSHMSIMSTVGVVPSPIIHYPIAGYIRMAELMSPLVERDSYGYVPATPITAPDLKRAYFTTPNRTEIALEFGQDMVWNAASAGLFYLDGVGGKVTSGSASGKVVKLQVTGASTCRTINYLVGGLWNGNQANILYGANGIAALTFYEVPLALSVLPSPTGLTASPNNNQVVLNCSTPIQFIPARVIAPIPFHLDARATGIDTATAFALRLRRALDPLANRSRDANPAIQRYPVRRLVASRTHFADTTLFPVTRRATPPRSLRRRPTPAGSARPRR